MGKSPTLLFLFLFSIYLLLISIVSKTTPPRPPKISHSTNLHNPFPPPPKIAYFISTSDGDGPRTVRLLSAVYHPSNRYLLHLDRRAAQAKRDDLAGVVWAVDAFTAAGNVFGKADPLNIEGPTAVAAVLRGAAALMRRWKDWDWFDYTRWLTVCDPEPQGRLVLHLGMGPPPKNTPFVPLQHESIPPSRLLPHSCLQL